MSKYIDAEKLKTEIDKILAKAEKDKEKALLQKDAASHLIAITKTAICARVKKSIASLQQEQPQLPGIEDPGIPGRDFIPVEWVDACEMYEKWKIVKQEQPSDMKSPFTGGKVTILSREEEITFRGEKIKITRKYYRCEDTGREFTDSKLDDDMMWAVFRAYCKKKGITSFTDIMLKQEQPSLPSNLDEAAEIDFMGRMDNHIFGMDFHKPDMISAFKAGAKWMAGLGYTKEETVYFERLCDENRIMVDLGWGEPERGGFNPGDKVVVQIRKAK